LLPRLERLAIDPDVKATVGDYLEAVGFDVVLAAREGVNVRDDLELFRWAKSENRSLVCHDKHRDRNSLIPIFQEISRYGGSIIRRGGTPDQSPTTSVGLIMVHRQQWLPFLNGHTGGIALVHRTGCRLRSLENLQQQLLNRGF
jgi:hypothetical protein